MERSFIRSALITALVLAAGLSFGAANSPEASGDVKTIKSSGKAQKSAEVKRTKGAAGKVKLVDIKGETCGHQQRQQGGTEETAGHQRRRS